MLATMIRLNKKIQGLKIGELTYLLSQYADDMDTFSKATRESVSSLFETLQQFKEISGFTVNYDKTCMYRIGSIRDTNAKCYVEKNLFWTNDPINILGVTLHYDERILQELNYAPLLEKTTNILRSWRKRNLSLIGKIQIINTLVASLFVYKMTVLRTINTETVRKLETLMNSFIWNDKRPKIPLNVLQLRKQDGGLKLVNFQRKDQALKISWVQILDTDAEMANLAYKQLIPCLQERIWKCNLNENDVQKVLPKTSFWTDTLQAWCSINFQESVKNPETQIIWLNSHITINRKPIIIEKCVEKGLMYLHQLFKAGTCISVKEAQERYELDIMTYNGIISALPRDWKKKCKNTDEQNTNDYLYETLIADCHIVSKSYDKLSENCSRLAQKCEKWAKDLNTTLHYEDYMKCFRDIDRVTNVAKFRSFQYRLLHRSLITNIHLHKWGIINSPLCSFCNSEVETTMHIMIWCPKVAHLWIHMELFMMQYSTKQIDFSPKNVITNQIITQTTHVKNAMCLFIKQFIYKQRCQKAELCIKECERYIRSIENNEKYYAVKNNRLSKHLRKWHPKEKDL